MRTVRRHGGSVPHILAAAACLLVALFTLLLSAGDAPATKAYVHGDIGIYDCDACHVNFHTEELPTNDYCQVTCHTDYQVVRSSDRCWTCHTPGQDMSWARSDASCLTTCHLRGGTDFAHAPHTGGSSACTTCHKVTAGPGTSAGSAHHTIPAPRLDSVWPAAAAPGASVTLSGAKFSWAAIVRFGGVNAAFTVLSDGVISASVPQSAVSGPVTVLSPGGLASSAAEFVVLRPEPPQASAVTLTASQSVLKLGRRVRLSGRLTPAGAAAQVRVVVQRRVAGVWKAAASSMRATDATGAYAWSYRPRAAGAFRARASAAGAASPRVTFRVR